MLACVAAFAQGKIAFNNDSLRLVYYDPSIPGVGGTAIFNSTVPLMADLYVGTSSSTLSLLTSSTFSTVAPGKWNLVNTTISGAPGGSAVFIIAQIRGASDAIIHRVEGGTLHRVAHFGSLAVAAVSGLVAVVFARRLLFSARAQLVLPRRSSARKGRSSDHAEDHPAPFVIRSA